MQPGVPGYCLGWKVTCNPGQGLAPLPVREHPPPAGLAWAFAAMAQITPARRSLASVPTVLGGGMGQG